MSTMIDIKSGDVITFDYVNYRGVRAHRTCTVLSFAYGHNDYHREDQWFVVGDDKSRPNGVRWFAMKDMKEVNTNVKGS